MSDRTKVAIAGINGRMGRATARFLSSSPDFVLGGALGKQGSSYLSKDAGDVVGIGTTGVSVTDSIDEALVGCQILLEFTPADLAVENAAKALAAGVRVVVGSSGLKESHLEKLASLACQHRLGVLVIPNFSVGAVLMMEFARQAGRHFSNVEIVEMHHTRKLDAPSGTAMHTVKKLAEAGHPFNVKEVDEHELVTGSRGGLSTAGVRVHSLRLPGLISHQDVIFGSPGELLTIRHESFNTDCFLNGINMSLTAVLRLDAMLVGLDAVIGLGNQSASQLAPTK